MAEEEKKEEKAEEKKNKKINKLTMAEIETALKKSEEHMGGHTSKYAQALLARKEELAAKS